MSGKILSINSIGAADSNRAAGTYANLTADATGASGDIAKARFTVVVDGSGAATVTIVDGGEDFAVSETIQINDAQLGNGGGAALTFDVATISSAEQTGQTGTLQRRRIISTTIMLLLQMILRKTLVLLWVLVKTCSFTPLLEI